MRSGMVGFLGAQPSSAGDPYWANVSSLLHFDGPDGSTTMTDEKGRIWTPNGNAQIDTSQSVWGGASLLLDGSGDYLSTASSSDINFTETSLGAIECWIRPSSVSGVRALFEKRNNSGLASGYIFFIEGAVLRCVAWGAGGALALNMYASTPIPTTDWTFAQLLMDGEQWSLATNGDIESSAVPSVPIVNTSTAALIGRDPTISSRDYAGHIDELRVTFGAERPAAIPAGPFPAA